MESRQVQQFKKGAIEMVLLVLYVRVKLTDMRLLKSCMNAAEEFFRDYKKGQFILFYISLKTSD